MPILGNAERVGLGGFNDAILRSAIEAGIPVIDLRLICTAPSDYSPLSPIEPSHIGGSKIAAAIVRVVTTHNFESRPAAIYI